MAYRTNVKQMLRYMIDYYYEIPKIFPLLLDQFFIIQSTLKVFWDIVKTFKKNYGLIQLLQIFKLELTVKIMLKLQNKILRNQNKHLSLSLAFSKLKNISLSHTNQVISVQSPSIKNKALYLDYVEKVLKNKQLDLIQLDRKLSQREKQINQIQFKKGVGQMIIYMETIKLIQKKLKSVQQKMGIRDEEYMMLYRKFQADCNKCKEQMQDAFKKQYNDMIHQRKILRSKLAQFSELQAYERYLNQLHNALQLKSQQIAQRQSSINSQSISQHQSNNMQQQPSNFESRNASELTNASNRKRIKIFNTKTHCTSQNPQNPSTLSIQSPNSKNLLHNETFARECHNYATQSSAIMGEDSKQLIQFDGQVNNTSSYQNNSTGKNNSRDVADMSYYNSGQKNINNLSSGRSQNKKKIIFKQQLQGQQQEHFNTNQKHYNYEGSSQKKKKKKVTDSSTQVSIQSLGEADQRLTKQALIIKYIKKWLKFSLNSCSKNSTINKKKLIVLNLWRINACFDQNIGQNAIRNLQLFEKLWKKQQRLQNSSRIFPYNQLTLKRRKYAQLMFDLQKKIYHRKKIESILRSILSNRHRKQRLIFFYYYCKFVKNSSNYRKVIKPNKQKSKQGNTLNQSRKATLSPIKGDMDSALSSRVLNQQKINFPNRKSTASLTNNTKSPSISKNPSTQKLSYKTGKQNANQDKKFQQQHAYKMKEFIAQKQRTERLLATQCVKLQGLIKMCVTLTEAGFRTSNYVMRKLTETQYYQKINTLSSQLNGLEFRFDLVLTKCKLGLANNSNKLSTLENLLDFTNFMK